MDLIIHFKLIISHDRSIFYKSYSLPLKFSKVQKICHVDRLFLFDSYLLNFCSDFTKTVTIESEKPGLSEYKRIFSVD